MLDWAHSYNDRCPLLTDDQVQQSSEKLVSLWVKAYEENPEHPTATSSFDDLTQELDAHINGLLDAGNGPAALLELDKILAQSFSLLDNNPETEDATVPFLHEVLPFFENLTYIDDKTQTPMIGFLMTSSVIGMREVAQDLAEKAQALRLEDAWTKTGILPPKAKVIWHSHALPAVAFSEWLAFDRLNYLQMAIDNPQQFQSFKSAPVSSYIDRTDLSVLMSVVIMPQADFEAAMKTPRFVFSDLHNFIGTPLHPEFPSEELKLAVQDRADALGQSIEILNQKMARAGIENTAIEEPGQIKNSLLDLLGWSLHVQQMHELNAMKLSDAQALDILQEGIPHLAVDVDKNELALIIQKDDLVVGPVVADFAWKQVSMNEVLEKLEEMKVIPDPQKATLYPTTSLMLAAVKGKSTRFRPH